MSPHPLAAEMVFATPKLARAYAVLVGMAARAALAQLIITVLLVTHVNIKTKQTKNKYSKSSAFTLLF